jgi:hypothetical protein
MLRPCESFAARGVDADLVKVGRRSEAKLIAPMAMGSWRVVPHRARRGDDFLAFCVAWESFPYA